MWASRRRWNLVTSSFRRLFPEASSWVDLSLKADLQTSSYHKGIVVRLATQQLKWFSLFWFDAWLRNCLIFWVGRRKNKSAEGCCVPLTFSKRKCQLDVMVTKHKGRKVKFVVKGWRVSYVYTPFAVPCYSQYTNGDER